MKKRILSIILSIVMLVSLLPTTALAMPSHTDHCVCGGSVTAGGHSCNNNTTWEAWDGTDKDIDSGGIQLTEGNWYLSKDVASTSNAKRIYIIGTVNLCLNGHSITNSGYEVIEVQSGATLNICDCKGNGRINYTGDGTSYSAVGNSGNLNIYSGALSGGRGIYNHSGHAVTIYGGSVSATGNGIYNESNCTVNIYGGTVIGGGYGIKSGTVNIYGGTVSGNTYGISDAKATISGGTVTSTGNDSYGISVDYGGSLALSGNPAITGGAAGIYLDNKEITIDGVLTSSAPIVVKMESYGTFTAGWNTYMSGVQEAELNKYFTPADNGYIVAKSGGELKIATTYTVTYDGNGATSGTAPVDNNSPYTNGERVTVLGNTGNLAKTGYVFLGWSKNADGTGTTYIPDNAFYIYSDRTLYAVWGRSVTGVKLDKDAISLTVGQTETLTATVSPDDATNKAVSWISSDPTVAKVENGVVTALKPGSATITVTTTDGGKTATCAVTVSAPAPAHSHYNCGVESCNADHNGDATGNGHSTVDSWTAWDGTTAFPGGNVYLTDDITLTEELTISGTVNLCLNGHSITNSATAAIEVKSGATLNICDCKGGGSVTNSGGTNLGGTTYGIYNSGTVNVYGGTISATTTATTTTAGSGSGIYNYSGQVTVAGTGAVVSGTLYGIYNNRTNGTVSVSDGTVSGEYGIYNKGSVIVSGEITVTGTDCGISNSGTVSISGGTVQATSSSGRGIYSTGGTVSVSGGIVQATGNGGYGIYNSGDAVSVSDGTVSGLTYGVFASGTGDITISGGEVSARNSASNSNSYGVYRLGSGAVEITGGTVSGKNGVYLYGSGNVTVSGGTVTGNGSGIYGYGIYLHSSSTGAVSVSGGTVSGTAYGVYTTGNSSGSVTVSGVANISGAQSGILHYGKGTVTVSGGTVKSPQRVTGTTSSGIKILTGSGNVTVSGGTVSGMDYGIYNGGTLTLSNAPTITGDTADIHLDSGKIITISGALTYTEENAISVKMDSAGTFTSGWKTKMGGNAANYGSYFTSANDGYTVQPDGNELKLAVPPTYTVTYDGNGATSGTVPTDGTSYASGSTVTVLGNTGNLAKTGYAFVGWNTWSSGYGADYAPGATFNINSNTTLYAQWEEYEITSQPTESTPAVGTNADGDIASYQWYKGTMSEVTDTADGVSAYTEDTLTSSYSDGWWTCHEAGGYSTPGYFTIVLNAGDSILAQTSDIINYAQLGIWAAYEKQDWDWTTPDDHFLVTAPADGNYDLHVSDVTGGGGTQPTVKAQVFHIGSTPADGATSKTLEADEDGWYACKITYADGTVLYSGPVEYEAPTISVTDVSLDKSSLTLDVGGTEQLTATVLPNNATDKTVTWHSDNGSIVTVDSNGNITAQNVGTTTITATAGGKTATCTVTVNAKALSAFNVTLSQDGFTYDGSAKTPTVIVKDGDTVLTEGTDYTVSYSDNTNAGTGKVTVTFTGNYSGSAKKNFTISKANQEGFAITGKPTGDIAYGGSFTLSTTGGNGDGAVSWAVTAGDAYAEIDSTGKVTVKGVGTVTITATKAESANYNVASDAYTFTSVKATPTYPMPANLTATYGQTLANVSLTNGWSWVNDSQSVGAVGTKSFDATFTPSDTVNYKTVEVKLTVTVGKATPVVAAPTAQNSITYGAKLNTVGLTDGWTWANGNTVPTVNNSGYTAYYTPNDTANFDWAAIEGWNASAGRVERTVAVTVNKSAPTYTAPTGLTATYGDTLANVSLPSGWTWKTPSASVGNAGVNSFKAVFTPDDTDNYDTVEIDVIVTVGKADASYTTPTGLTATYGDTLADVSLPSGWTWKTPSASVGNVGINSFKAVYTPSDTDNFNAAEVDVSVTVGKADSSCTAPVAVDNLVYTGSAQPLVNAGSTTTGAMQYALGSITEPTGSWSATLPQGQNAGTYYIWYKVVGDDNHNDVAPACVAVTIAKKQIAKPAADNSTFTYNGSYQTYAMNGDPAFIIDNKVQKNAGSYTVTVTLQDTANYEWTDGTTAVLEYTFKIEQKELGIAWSNTTLTYNGAAQQPTATATGVVAGEQIALVLGAPATNAGSYTATVHSIDGATAQNYKLPTNKSTSFTIEQQALTIVWGNSNFTYDGAEKFPAFNVDGIWNADDVQVTKEGAQTNAGEYTAQIIGLTGSDAGNYKLTGTLTKDFVINKADQAAPAVNKADETISGKNDGKITDVTANMEYRAEGEDHYTAITGETVENLADGKYYVRVKGDSNHNPSADTAVVIGAGRMLTVTVPQNQVGYTMITTTPEVEYFGSIRVEFKLHDGYSMTDSFQICNGTDPVGFSLMGDTYVYELNFVNSDFNFTVSGVADITAPLAQIDIKNNKWTSFWNGVTFGLFFNETQDVTVTAADTGSGMNSIQYYLAGGELELDEVKQITDWQDYSSTFQIDPDNAYVVYVKVTDNAGNVSYLNSAGVVLDQTVPVLVGIENNGSYYGDQCFKALDDYLDALKVDGVDVTDEMNADNEYTIVADNAEHIVTATDKAGNATEYKITVFKNYTVTYKVDGNTVSTQTVGHGKDATAPTIPEKEGYTQTAPVWDKDGTNITADTEINAVYTINKYTVTYKADGQAVDTQTIEHGANATPPTVPAKEGYTQIAPVWDKDGKNITVDTEINAVYTINKYTVTYVADGETISTQTIEHGADATAPAVPKKVGYTQVAPYWDGDGKNITTNTTITAVYTINKYTVTYKADGQVVDTQTIEHGANATPPTVPAKEGYTQIAPVWDKDGKNITVDTEINAVYTINKYTVTYVADGETISTQTIEHGADATAPAVPKKVGYTQVAPYWDKDGKNITTDTEINAVYTINKYNVTFNSNGGNKVDGIPDVIHDTVITAPTAPTKENATFAGWFSDSACTKAWNFDTDTVTADLTLYAKWSDVPVFHISGKVVEETDDGENDTSVVPNANVKLMLGTTLIATETTDENGLFYFGGQKAGDYNVVVTSGDKVVTVLVTLHDHDEDGLTVELPKTITNSIVEHEPAADGKDSVAAGTLVGGLEDVAAAVRSENQSADKVEVKLTVKDTPPVTGTPTAGTEAAKQQAQQKAIQQKAGGKQLVFFDLSVVKTINGGTPVAITDTGDTLLEIRIPFDSGNKWGITIYRYHGDKAEVLAAVREGSTTEGFWVGDDGYIHIYTHKFSTYAVGYTVPSYGYFVPVTPDTVTSADTFDAGIVVYVTMSMLAATGSAVVIGKKRKEEN